MKGIVLDIQKFCLQDGPGIRTTVFLKGCNMNCQWCHNPESIEMKPTLMFFKEKCTLCNRCGEVCKEGVHSFQKNRHLIERNLCVECGKCADACLNGALEIIGKEYNVKQVMEEIKKDGKYYASSGGGVTFSGGEASLQYEFLLELLQSCKEMKYNTALETNGLISKERVTELLQYVDLFLLDYKVTDIEEAKKRTGVSNAAVVTTLKTIQELGGTVFLRCPMIPGINDTEEHFEAIRTLKKNYSCIKQVEVMAYHDTGKGKWQQCGKTYELAHLKTVSQEQKEVWERKLCQQPNAADGRTYGNTGFRKFSK